MPNESRTADSLADYLADPRTILPEPADAQQAAERAAALYERSSRQYEQGLSTSIGATFNLYFDDMSGQPYYAVALYSDLVPDPDLGKNADIRVLRSLIVQNWELLLDPRNNIGLWYDDKDDLLYLDISAAMPDKSEAVRLGERYNEKEGFDLERGEPFPIGGTGIPTEGLPPPAERLPSLVRKGSSGESYE